MKREDAGTLSLLETYLINKQILSFVQRPGVR